jgi:hypothetical protein
MSNRFENIKGFLVNSERQQGRTSKIEGLQKQALGDQHGAFQHFQSNVAEYATRDRYLATRGGELLGRDTDSLYGITPDHEDSYVPTELPAPHLSTRYSPDRVGVQAMRVSDGVFQDPYTNKVYDYNDGFKAEDGRTFPGGGAALQSSMMHLANHLDKTGLIKEANYLDILLKRADVYPSSDHSGLQEDIDQLGARVDRLHPEEAMQGSPGASDEPTGGCPHGTDLFQKEDGSWWCNAGSDQYPADPDLLNQDFAHDLMTLSNHLDKIGLIKEADFLDDIIKKEAGQGSLTNLRLRRMLATDGESKRRLTEEIRTLKINKANAKALRVANNTYSKQICNLLGNEGRDYLAPVEFEAILGFVRTSIADAQAGWSSVAAEETPAAAPGAADAQAAEEISDAERRRERGGSFMGVRSPRERPSGGASGASYEGE